MENMKKYVAEFIGTLVLVLFACGTAAVVGCNGADPNAAYLMTALAFGLEIVAMAYSIGNISGCHINPAVSIAMLVSGKMSVKDFVGYVVAQFLGAIAGAAILMGILGGTELGLGQNGLFEGSIVRSLIVEIILTFVFVLAILGVTSKPEFSKVAGLVIGFSLTLVHIIGIHFTGTSVNLPEASDRRCSWAGTLWQTYGYLLWRHWLAAYWLPWYGSSFPPKRKPDFLKPTE